MKKTLFLFAVIAVFFAKSLHAYEIKTTDMKVYEFVLPAADDVVISKEVLGKLEVEEENVLVVSVFEVNEGSGTAVQKWMKRGEGLGHETVIDYIVVKNDEDVLTLAAEGRIISFYKGGFFWYSGLELGAIRTSFGMYERP